MTPPDISSELARQFAALETLRVGRPATASIGEYLAALASEGVIDPKTAALVGAAYNRLRYAEAVPADLELRQASESLSTSISAFAARSDEERRVVSERIRQRLSSEGELAAAGMNAAESANPATAFDARLLTTSADSSSQFAGDMDPTPNFLAEPEPDAKELKRRRGIRISSVPLETATLVVVGLVVSGYILRGGTDHAISPAASEAFGSKRAKVFAADIWRNDDYWAHNLRRRAETEAARKQERTARLGFELLIGESPKDAGALNDLAWLYLTSDDLSLRDPHRGLELALRAVAISRLPALLDTLAEARFQTGAPDEAVKLEKEAIDSLPRLSGFQDTQFTSTLRRQLAKFESAAKANATQASAPAH